jgi:hypothetical protein
MEERPILFLQKTRIIKHEWGILQRTFSQKEHRSKGGVSHNDRKMWQRLHPQAHQDSCVPGRRELWGSVFQVSRKPQK